MVGSGLKIEQNMTDVYMIIRKFPAWLSHCQSAGFSPEEILYLEYLDDELSSYDPEGDANRWAEGVMRRGGPNVDLAESDDQAIDAISSDIGNIYLELGELLKANTPFKFLGFWLNNIARLEKIRHRLRGSQIHSKSGKFKESAITDQDIERARKFPLEKLIPEFDMERGGYILCKWHDDKKPSMLVKNGFGYCFSCHKHIDSIGWMMEVNNLNFVDAVKALI